MTIFIYHNLYNYQKDVSQPSKVIANLPFIFDRDIGIVKIYMPNEVKCIKYYSYEFINNNLYLWENA